MLGIGKALRCICSPCFPTWQIGIIKPTNYIVRSFSKSPQPQTRTASKRDEAPNKQNTVEREEEAGAMAQRLEQMTEEALQTGGRRARKAIEEAGFSEELKRQLEAKIAGADFRSQHASSFAHVNLPQSAGRGTRDISGTQPWAGTESVGDTVLRMLTDAHKPLRVPGHSKIPPAQGPPTRVDTGRPGHMVSSGARLANARDRSSIYATLKDSGMTPEEREKYFKEVKDRFRPHARAVPATLQGLASLADERIEDAIARGLFKNLPRGKKIKRDYNASSPFIDTTEYLMNKIIQQQDIVPPWIEKQQELASSATKFRARLRSDWKRHAARMIASKGGTLEEQMRRAESYAAAEAIANPPRRKGEKASVGDSAGVFSQITPSGELVVTQARQPTTSPATPRSTSQLSVAEAPLSPEASARTSDSQPTVEISAGDPPVSDGIPSSFSSRNPTSGTAPIVPPAPQPFRDSAWEATELSYHSLTITHLNNLTRSYNLMAPDLAKKPYYSLERELRACYAEVAPQLPAAIRERATRPARSTLMSEGKGSGGALGDVFSSANVRIQDERKERRYGFREFWRDLWSRGG